MNHADAELRVKEIVQILANTRKAVGISQYRLAELTRLSREAIRLIEKGDRTPTLHSLLLIASALNVNLGRILEERDSTEK